ncbi:MAG: RbsD/FucU domain-containing protein [Terracidiphilus sp.]
MAAATTTNTHKTQQSAWEQELLHRLPVFGHRNWIVVADSAYPAQSKPGIETIVAGGDHVATVAAVLKRIAASGHVRANVYTDLEIDYVAESDAPGIGACRQRLRALLHGANINQLPHEQIIAKLDERAQVFRVLIIKTSLALPYTSVFFELDCGYWNADAEERLRKAMQQ